MGLIANIRSGLSRTVGTAFSDGLVDYRPLTSNANANPRSYGAWVSVTPARLIIGDKSTVQDADTGIWFTLELGELRVPDHANIDLFSRGDQVRTRQLVTDAGVIWDVAKRLNSGAGSIVGYLLEIKTPVISNHRRGSL